jgi:protein-tyrosine phosphatase
MIDLHSHILPGVDDGPGDMDRALVLARAFVATDTRIVAATPHINRHYGIDADRMAAGVAELEAELAREAIPLEVRSGGEIDIVRARDLGDDELRALALGGGPHVLLECPLSYVTDTLESTALDFMRRGHRVLLAHPERSPALLEDPARIGELVARGALAQVTAGAFTGEFGEPVRRFALELLRDELVHVVACDAHDVDLRPPDAPAALAAAERGLPGSGALWPWLTEEVPAAILAGEPLPPRPRLARRRPRRRRRLRSRA